MHLGESLWIHVTVFYVYVIVRLKLYQIISASNGVRENSVSSRVCWSRGPIL